ncbi:MAG: cache domain-containing protein [Oceanospirillaceae bacterium]|nr:cache domain-containing protein [Oceanospirillaceae bacterium]
MKLSKKIGVIVCLLAITMFFFYIFAVNTLKNQLIEARKHEIQSILTFSVNQARHFVELEQANKMSREEAEENVIRLLSSVRDGNNFLWANDANGIARVHVKNKVVGVFQRSYVKYIDYLNKHDFMFVVGESEKADSNALFVKVNGMTLLPQWKWMLGMGVYVDDLEAEANQLASYFILASAAMLLVILAGIFWVYRSIIHQLGDDPQNVIRFAEQFENEGLQAVKNKSYPKNSLLFMLVNLYQYIQCIFDSLRHQTQTIAEHGAKLSNVSKELETFIDVMDQEEKQISRGLADNKKCIQEAYSELTKSEQYLDMVASRFSDNTLIHSNNEKELTKIAGGISNDAKQLQVLRHKVSQLEEKLVASDNAFSQHSVLSDTKASLNELDDDIAFIESSVSQSDRELIEALDAFSKQRVSLESFIEHIVSIKLQLAQVKSVLLREFPNEIDLNIDDISSSLSAIMALTTELKKSADKISYDLGCIKL